MVLDLRDALGILIAALGGAAVGLEREWSGHATDPGARFAGPLLFWVCWRVWKAGCGRTGCRFSLSYYWLVAAR
jgi:hypothetical protein